MNVVALTPVFRKRRRCRPLWSGDRLAPRGSQRDAADGRANLLQLIVETDAFQQPSRIRVNRDAGTDFPQDLCLLEYACIETTCAQRQRSGQTSDAAADDYNAKREPGISFRPLLPAETETTRRGCVCPRESLVDAPGRIGPGRARPDWCDAAGIDCRARHDRANGGLLLDQFIVSPKHPTQRRGAGCSAMSLYYTTVKFNQGKIGSSIQISRGAVLAAGTAAVHSIEEIGSGRVVTSYARAQRSPASLARTASWRLSKTVSSTRCQYASDLAFRKVRSSPASGSELESVVELTIM